MSLTPRGKEIFSPYRMCPLGAHVDHQGGAALGRTVRLGTELQYEPLDSQEIWIRSDQFGDARFRIGELDQDHWARYAQAAARVLPVRKGMRAHVSGSLVGSGLSSSASVGLAYLKALADVNEIVLSREQLVRLDYVLEHEQLKLQNGVLDPLTVVYGRADALLLLDTRAVSVTPILDPPGSGAAWIVAYSGVSRELTRSGFNIRVEECQQAAALLREEARMLSDVSRDVFDARKTTLPENLRKRAEHFFGEVERVREGAAAWITSDLQRFGQLMNQSCESSIKNYESGSDILIELHELVSSSPGVYGSRFSGGGYGGCVVALAERRRAEALCIEIADNFRRLHPELPSRVFVVETGDGLR